MELTESGLAYDVILTNAREGTSGFEVAQCIKRVARDLEDARRDTHAGVAGVLPSGVREFVRSPEALSHIDVQQVETTLNKTASDIQSIVGGKEVVELDAGVAGQALQGVAGSSQIDVTSSIQANAAGSSIIDAVWLSDVVDHEKRHEVQASSWNADEVLVEQGGSVLTITRRDISEADAMLVQSSIENVSGEYKQIFQTVTGILTPEQIQSVAQSGDLAGLAEQMQTTEDATSV
ncbi:hypothetical protein KJ996_05570 [Patescibacteria group bacterium]|nr:hypothetical protein [Patescibacteria group bacterium]